MQGSTLAEISRTVEEINATINERKVRLAPQIKKLRAVRQAFAVSGGCLQRSMMCGDYREVGGLQLLRAVPWPHEGGALMQAGSLFLLEPLL
jgi:hypothetical protein